MATRTPTVDQMVASLPPGLERELLRQIGQHVGRSQAIARNALLAAVRQGAGCGKVSDRELRLQINLLRKAGEPICAAAGDNGGYYWAANWAELNEYLEREVHSRAMDLLEQEVALKAAAQRRWGPQQIGFFI